MSTNKLIIAGAGSGKTTYIVNEAIKNTSKPILITTFTQANESAIRQKLIKRAGCIPAHVTVQTWFSFLLQHGVRPYQGSRYRGKVQGLFLKSGQSATGIAETDTDRHYFTTDKKIYSDKVAKFTIKCNELNDGAVVQRLAKIYGGIYIDEVQDLAGYDLEFLKLLIAGQMDLTLVGDPRQATYSTNDSSKNKKFKKSAILNFFSDKSIQIDTDDTTLNINYRCESNICDISNKLYPDMRQVKSGAKITDRHKGLFLVKSSDADAYLLRYELTMQLRDSIKTKSVNTKYAVMNFGASKGLEFNRVLIYPTKPMIDWLKSGDSTLLKPVSRSKMYVALTRARTSVAFVCDEDIDSSVFNKWCSPKESVTFPA